MKKPIKTLIPIVLACGLLLGCGGKKGSSSGTSSSAQTSSEQSSSEQVSSEEKSSEQISSQEQSSSEQISSQEQSSSEFISSSEEASSESTSIDPTVRVTVNFYIDYDHTHYRVRYYRTYVNNGELITDVPETPEAPLPEFPIFVGWSTKEVTDDYDNDIWDFANDHVMLTNSNTLNFYGIWAAE